LICWLLLLAQVEPASFAKGFGFDYPFGPPDGIPRCPNDAPCLSGWYNFQDFANHDNEHDKPHLGEDWNLAPSDYPGVSIYSVADGVVTYAADTGLCAWKGVIIILHTGFTFQVPGGESVDRVCSMYAHLDVEKINNWVSRGGTVERGQKIGEIGPTPCGSTGPHLHFEMRTDVTKDVGPGYSYDTTGWTDPSDFIEANRPVARIFQSAYRSEFGVSLTPLYDWGDLQRQDFQYALMTYNPRIDAVIVDGWPHGVGPGVTTDGWTPEVSSYFVQAYNKHGSARSWGFPFPDAGNPVRVHQWGDYWIQNFTSGELGEAAIMLDPTSPIEQRKAVPIQGQFWNWYRYNDGPAYRLQDGKPLGCPRSPERYEGDLVVQDFTNGTLTWNKTTVLPYPKVQFQIAGGSLGIQDIDVWVTSVTFNQVQIQWENIGADFYVVFINEEPAHITATTSLTHTTVRPSSVYRYEVFGGFNGSGLSAHSPVIEVTTPPDLRTFTLSASPETYDDVHLVWYDDRFQPPLYGVLQDGQEVARLFAFQWTDYTIHYLDPETTYTFQLTALTADHLELGRSNSVDIVTGSIPVPTPSPTWTPVPDPALTVKLLAPGIQALEPPPYAKGQNVTVDFTVEAYAPITLERAYAQGIFQDDTGGLYEKAWPAQNFDPPLVLNPGDRMHYQASRSVIEGLATIKPYVKIYTYAGMRVVTEADPGAAAQLIIEVGIPTATPTASPTSSPTPTPTLTAWPTPPSELNLIVSDGLTVTGSLRRDELATFDLELKNLWPGTVNVQQVVIRLSNSSEVQEILASAEPIGIAEGGMLRLRQTIERFTIAPGSCTAEIWCQDPSGYWKQVTASLPGAEWRITFLILAASTPTPTIPTATATWTPHEADTETPTHTMTPTPLVGLPDLVCDAIEVDPTNPCLIAGQENRPRTKISIGNVGGSDTGPFVVRVLFLGRFEERLLSGLSIASASEITVISNPFIPNCALNYGITVEVDLGNAVIEANEENNTRSSMLFFGCCDATHTATPTTSQTGTHTPTPLSPTETPTIAETSSPTPTDILSASFTPTLTDTSIPTLTPTVSETGTPTPLMDYDLWPTGTPDASINAGDLLEMFHHGLNDPSLLFDFSIYWGDLNFVNGHHGAFCGDGVVNQPDEECDGEAGVTPGCKCSGACIQDCSGEEKSNP
jgi:hypothetical protein